jgi:hypothetical protein
MSISTGARGLLNENSGSGHFWWLPSSAVESKDGRGSLGPMANTPFPSPLIKSDEPIPASGFPTGFTVRDPLRQASHAVPSQPATSGRKHCRRARFRLPERIAPADCTPRRRGRLAAVDRRVAGGARWNRSAGQACRTARQALGCSTR